MPSTTPDLSTVTCGGASRLAAPDGASASAKVDGDRPPRRGGASPGRPRSGFGQASSNDGGGSETGGASDGWGRRSGDSRSGANGSLVRVAARSRSLREDEENNRLRRGLSPGGASAGCGADGACAGPPSCDAVPSGPAAAFSPGGWSRLNRKPLVSPGCPRGAADSSV